jgi:hypothetical protein
MEAAMTTQQRRGCERWTNKDVGQARTWRLSRSAASYSSRTLLRPLRPACGVDAALSGSGWMRPRRDSQKSAASRRGIRRWVDQSGLVVFLTRGGPMDRLVWRMHEAMSL